MSKLNGRRPVEIKLPDLQNQNIPIYDSNDRLWNTINVLDILTGSVSLSGSNTLIGDQIVSGNLIITGAVTGSFFTGSFKGDGSQLTNIPVSGVTGLNTTRIADGNATASISNTEGLRINTNTEITGSLIVSGSATVVGNLYVTGTTYHTDVTASTLLVNDNWITVTTTSSLGRFGGIRILDYEGVNETASLAWDTLADRWLEIPPLHDTYSSSLFIMGPKNTGSLGSEVGLTPNRIPRADDEHHIIDSAISDNGTEIILGRNTVITGSLLITGSNKLIGDTQLTGSLTVSGSTTQIGNNTLFGTTLLSGSITISGSLNTTIPTVKIYGDIEQNGYTKYLPVNTNIDTSISGSYIFVSGSTDDLYFSQNGAGFSNVTRLRWLEGNLYTGLLNGGLISATPGGTTFNIGAGSGIIVNLNGSLTDNPYPTIKYVNWNTFTGQTLLYRTTNVQTFVGIDQNGAITQQVEAFSNGTYNTQLTLGTVIHQNLSTVNATITYPNLAYGYKQRTYDFIKAFGPLKLSGLSLVTANTIGLNVGSGTAYADGRNYQNDPNNPSYITDSGTTVSKIFRYYQVSGNTFVQDTNNSSGYTELDVANYNNNGTITAVPGTGSNRQWSLQRIFWYPNSATKGIVAYYGNKTYTSSTEAAANLPYEPFFETENTKQNAIYLGAVAVRNDATWADSASYLILPGGTFRNVGGSGGGGNVPSNRLTDLIDVDVANDAANGDLLIYNSNNSLWQHGKQLTGDYAITGSLNVSNTISGSFAGNGSGLTGISISGVSGLDVTKIISGALSASLENNAFRVNTDMYVNGTLTAREIHTSIVTSSVLYESGSTKFGDTLDDTHQFTGSVLITGSLGIINATLLNQNNSGLSLGIQTISSNSTGSYTSAFYNYTLASGSNARAGQVFTVWNGNSISYTDNSTTDIGNTSTVALTASLSTGNVVLSTSLPTNGWTIKTFVNLL